MAKSVPHEVEYALKWWNRCAIGLRILYICLTMLSIICSVVVGSISAAVASSSASSTSGLGFLEIWHVAVLSITAAIAVGILSALDIRGNADRFRRAWAWLEMAKTDYRLLNDSKKNLICVYKTAQRMLLGDKAAVKV